MHMPKTSFKLAAIVLGLLILVANTVNASDPCTTEQKRLTPPQAKETINPDLEATITLAELQEILIKVEQDLSERIDEVEYADKDELINVLKTKKLMIMTYLKELQGFDEETVALYLAQGQRKKSNALFWFVASILGITATSALVMASYDHDTGFNQPSIDQLNINLERIKLFLSPVQQNLVPPPNPQPNQPDPQPNQPNQQPNQPEQPLNKPIPQQTPLKKTNLDPDDVHISSASESDEDYQPHTEIEIECDIEINPIDAKLGPMPILEDDDFIKTNPDASVATRTRGARNARKI